MAIPTAPPPTNCGIDTSTGTFRAAPAPIMVMGSAPRPAMRSKGTPASAARSRTWRASRSIRRPMGHAMFPAALITMLPSRANKQSYRSHPSGISAWMAERCARDSSVSSKTPPRGNRSAGIGRFTSGPISAPIGMRFTRSSVPAISCATTAELVIAPSTNPRWIIPAISVVTPSWMLGPLPVTTTTFPPRCLALTMD